jgi:hypothetical protein
VKRCPTCGITKEPTGFFHDPRRSDGLSTMCKACRLAYKRGRPIGAPVCEPCGNRQHGPRCSGAPVGCPCRCRAMLGLNGPFEGGDPTAPDVTDQVGVGRMSRKGARV